MKISTLSTKAVTTVNVSYGSCNNYQFTIWAYNSPNLPIYSNEPSISASQLGDGFMQFVMDFDNKDEGNMVCPENRSSKWTLTIVNSITGDLVLKRQQTENSCIVNTIGWEPGMYIVRGELDGDVSTIKISI